MTNKTVDVTFTGQMTYDDGIEPPVEPPIEPPVDPIPEPEPDPEPPTGNERDMVLELDQVQSGTYGNEYNGAINTTGLIKASFQGDGSDLILKFDGYDVDYKDEVEVLINDNSLGFLDAGINEGVAAYEFELPVDLQVEGENIITFAQRRDVEWKWGVTNVVISKPVVVVPETPIGDSDYQYRIIEENPNLTDKGSMLSVTLEDHGNGNVGGGGFYPTVFRRPYRVEQGHKNRIIHSKMHDGSYTPEIFKGGNADVYRIINGVFTLVMQCKVTGGDWAKWFGIEQKAETKELSYSHHFAKWEGRGQEVWFGVAAKGADGKTGAIGYIGYTPTQRTAIKSTGGEAKIKGGDIVWGGDLPAPANITIEPHPEADDTILIKYDAVEGAETYQLLKSFNVHPDKINIDGPRYLEVENNTGETILKDDYVLVSNRIMKPRANMVSTQMRNHNNTIKRLKPDCLTHDLEEVVSSSAYKEWGDDKPDPSLGTMYAEIVAKPNQKKVKLIGDFWASGQNQSWYTSPMVGETYKFKWWVNFSREVTATFGSGIGGAGFEKITFAPGFTKFEREITVTENMVGSKARKWEFYADTMDGEPFTVQFAQARVYNAETEYHEFTAQEAAIHRPKVILRDHTNIKGFVVTADIEAFTNPSGESPRGSTFDSLCKKCVQTGMVPYLQIPPYYTWDDHQDLIAYYSAPVESGHRMALKRAANGRVEPWSDEFEGFCYERGNESWNKFSPSFWGSEGNLVDFETGRVYTDAEFYGLGIKYATDAIEASPFYKGDMTIVVGGRSLLHSTYGQIAAKMLGKPCIITIAAYNGGWEEKGSNVKETPLGFTNVLQNRALSTGPRNEALAAKAKALSDEMGYPIYWGTYEGGPGYRLNGLNNSKLNFADIRAQEYVMKSVAGGTATLDSFLYQASLGNVIINYFVTGTLNYWSTMSPKWHSGETFPSWELNAIVHEQMPDYKIYKATTIADPKISVQKNEKDDKTFINVDRLAVYYLTSGNDVMLAVCNLSIDDAENVLIKTPMKSAASQTFWGNIGEYNASNRDKLGLRMTTDRTWIDYPLSKSLKIEPEDQPVTDDLGIFKIPLIRGGNAMLFKFGGVTT